MCSWLNICALWIIGCLTCSLLPDNAANLIVLWNKNWLLNIEYLESLIKVNSWSYSATCLQIFFATLRNTAWFLLILCCARLLLSCLQQLCDLFVFLIFPLFHSHLAAYPLACVCVWGEGGCFLLVWHPGSLVAFVHSCYPSSHHHAVLSSGFSPSLARCPCYVSLAKLKCWSLLKNKIFSSTFFLFQSFNFRFSVSQVFFSTVITLYSSFWLFQPCLLIVHSCHRSHWLQSSSFT